MRVLIVTGSLPPMPCGVGAYSLQLAMALAREPQIEVGILTGLDGVDNRQSGNVAIFPVMERWTFKEIGHLVRTIRHWKPDLVHVQYPTQGYGYARLPALVPLISRLLGRRVICTLHEAYGQRDMLRFLVQSWPAAMSIVVRPNYDALLPRLALILAPPRCRTFIASASAIPRSVASPAARAALRASLLGTRSRLLVFFGFLNKPKGADRLFDIGNPETDHLVFGGPGDPADDCLGALSDRAAAPPWSGNVTFTGLLPASQCADLLAAADAVVLPFRDGGGIWNSSIQAAVLQGVPVITTSKTEQGLDSIRHVHSSAPDDIDDMRSALDRLAGTHRSPSPALQADEWSGIAARHVEIYQTALRMDAAQRAFA